MNKSILFFAAGLCLLSAEAWGQSVYEPYTFSTFAGVAGSAGSANGTGHQARFTSPTGLAVDGADNLYVADTGNNTIRKVTPAGVVSTFAGSAGHSGSADGTAGAARFNAPIGLTIDGAGNLYVGDSGNHTIRKITPAAAVTTLAGSPGNPGSDNGTGSVARFNGPRGVAVDAAGNVYVADTFNNTIRKVTPAGAVSTLAGLAGEFGSADGVGSVARFNRPRGVAVGGASNVYVADTANDLIRRISSTKAVTTVAGLAGSSGSADGSVFAARFFGPVGIAVSPAKDIYLADTVNDTIRKISFSGAVTTLGGVPLMAGSANGTGAAARFASPQGVALDSAGRFFVADTGNNTIRLVAPSPTPTPTPTPSPSTSPTPTPTPTPSPSTSPTPTPGPGRAQPLNISTRMRVGTDQNVLIGGFIVVGNGSKPILFRAIGPSLADAGLSDFLPDPVLELHAADGSLIRMNDNWRDNPAQATLIEATGIPPTDPSEAAIVATLAPGNYTAVVHGKGSATGIGLVEIYDLDRSVGSVVANISTRGLVQGGDDVMIGGFILGEGSDPAPVLVRALGPSLTDQGLTGVLRNPTLELHNENGDLIGSNDDWKSNQQTEIEATGVPPPNKLESAITADLPPGHYTAIVAGKNGATGVALVEVYALQQ
ncbi:MAG TPA: NHL repeat-containing protein [Chthoniobacterales bacterium]